MEIMCFSFFTQSIKKCIAEWGGQTRASISILTLVVSVFSWPAWSLPDEKGDKGYSIGELNFRPCLITVPHAGYSRKIDCATMSVPQNYDLPAAKNITLRIARLPSSSYRPAADPLVMIAGGPGQSAVESFLFADKQYKKVSKERDIYLIDQRGTGGSAPLECEAYTDTALLNKRDIQHIRTSTSLCLTQLEHDPKFFTTAVAIKDLEAVRQALNIDEWNIYGGSYGTVVAQHYMRAFPQAIRSAILDGVVDLTRSLAESISIESQDALDTLFARCAITPSCAQAFPDLKPKVQVLLKRLKTRDIPVAFEDIQSGKIEQVDFSLDHFTGAVRMALYNDVVFATLPSVLYEAAEHKNYAPLIRQARVIDSSIGQMLNTAMHMSVVCTEDKAFRSDSQALTELRREEMQAVYMGDDFLSILAAVCDTWPKGKIDAGFNQQLVSTKPVLLFSGENDPVTPPHYAESAMKKLHNARHIIVKGRGHIVAGVGCNKTLVAKFLAKPDPTKLDFSCMDKIEPAPFFVNFNSPKP